MSLKHDLPVFLRCLTAPSSVHSGILPVLDRPALSAITAGPLEDAAVLVSVAKLVKLGICDIPKISVLNLSGYTSALSVKERCELLWALGVLMGPGAEVAEAQTELRRLVRLQDVGDLSFLSLEQLLRGLQRLHLAEGGVYEAAREALDRRMKAENASSGQAVEAAYWLSAYGEDVDRKYLEIAANKVDVLKVEEKIMAKQSLDMMAKRGVLEDTLKYLKEAEIFDRKHRSQLKWAQVRIRF